jgi:hypothetical protein
VLPRATLRNGFKYGEFEQPKKKDVPFWNISRAARANNDTQAASLTGDGAKRRRLQIVA